MRCRARRPFYSLDRDGNDETNESGQTWLYYVINCNFHQRDSPSCAKYPKKKLNEMRIRNQFFFFSLILSCSNLWNRTECGAANERANTNGNNNEQQQRKNLYVICKVEKKENVNWSKENWRTNAKKKCAPIKQQRALVYSIAIAYVLYAPWQRVEQSRKRVGENQRHPCRRKAKKKEPNERNENSWNIAAWIFFQTFFFFFSFLPDGQRAQRYWYICTMQRVTTIAYIF